MSAQVISAGITAIVVVAAGAAQAQDKYPSRPIRLLVAQAAGGPTDIAARVYATKMTELLGQQIVTDNRPGAGGSIAGEVVANAQADGYTLMVAANGTIAVAPHLMKLPYDARKQLIAIGLIGNSPLALMVNLKLPVKSVKDLIALAKAKPGTINFGSSAIGATSHLAGEMLKMLTGINIVHVPYKGAAPALLGVASGEVQMLISGVSSGLPFIERKQLRALAVSTAKRVPALPDVPPMVEAVPGYDVGSWYAAFVTAGTPRAIVDRLHRESVRAIQAPDVSSKLSSLGMLLETPSLPELAKKIAAERERWGKVVQAAGLGLKK